MVLGRKFIIWFISFAVVLGAFLLYRGANDAGVIEITTLDSGVDANDANMLFADSNAGQIGQAKLEYLQRSRFETVDARTRKLKRVVGFEKVLHKTGNEWELDKPYMNVFQDKLRCDITADTGTIEVENVEGSNPAPKSAVLKNNVVIHIMPETTASMSDSFIYLNEVTFDSDRSMFFSDNDVNFISADAHLVGKGLEVVYNSITNRLEYLKIMHVDYLNITSIQQVKKLEEKKAKLIRLRKELADLPAHTPKVIVKILVELAIPRAEEEVWFFSNIGKMEAGFILIDQLLSEIFGLDPKRVAGFDYQADSSPGMPWLSDIERLRRFRIAFQLLEILVREHGYPSWGLTRQSLF